jgi:ankyrin repeat protein
MILLHASDTLGYKAELPKRETGTCCWILKHPEYVSWNSEQRNTLLWITGNPGCGKTILSAYLADHLDSVQRNRLHGTVCYFFCDDKSAAQRDGKAILRGIIYQLLQRRRCLIKHVKAAFNFQGPQLVESFHSLWNVFVRIIKDYTFGPINVVIDAIDECEEETRTKFLNAITELVGETSADNDVMPTSIKFLITSRPSISASYSFNDVWRHRIPIEEDPSVTTKDIHLVIDRRVQEIAERCQCSPKTKALLEDALYSRAEQTFLWVDIVLQLLEKSLLASAKDFQRILNTIPQKLEIILESFVRNIPPSQEDLAAKMLHILVGSPRQLTLDEFNILLAIDNTHKTMADVEADCQPSIGRTIQGILGPLVRVVDSKVFLVHQSAKEFLLDLATHSESPLSSVYGVVRAKAALIIANSCVLYLLLQDFQDDKFSLGHAASESGSETSPFPEAASMTDVELAFSPFELEEATIFKDEAAVDAEACKRLSDSYRLYDFASLYWAETYSYCEEIASQDLKEAATRLKETSCFQTSNWLRYFWLKTGMEYNIPEEFGPLSVSSFFNHSISLTRLLDGNDPFIHEKDRALFWAARRGCTSATEILLRNRSEPNSTTVHRQMPLNVAAECGHLDVVKMLLADERTDVNWKGKLGRTPLSLASANGHLSVVTLLLDHSLCRPDEEDHNRWTALFWAVGGNHSDVVSALLNDNRVNVNHTDRIGRSAFSWAAGDGLAGPSKLLLRNQILQPNLHDSKGRSALSWAAGNGHRETVEILLRDNRCDRDAKDANLRNAVSWACEGGHDGTLKVLIQYNCPGIDEEDVDGWTPLAWALNNRSLATVEMLVKTGLVDIDHKDRSARTPLSFAAGYGYLDVVQFLLRAGASVDSRDDEGRKAVERAELFGYADVAQELQSWEAR